MELRDLSPEYDPKGGSPKSPYPPIPASEYQPPAQLQPIPHNDTIWKMATSILAGINIGLVVALFTALSSKGVTHPELEDYVDKHSPYLMDKQVLIEHNTVQDRDIGRAVGSIEEASRRLGVLDAKQEACARDIGEFRTKVDIVAKMLEEQKRK